MERHRSKEQLRTGVTGGAEEARFTFIDLFAGIGGFRIGLERLGGGCVYSVERDKFARKTYAAWFGGEPEGEDINHIVHAEIPAHDVLAAGFPCPAFSKAGESKRRSLSRASGLAAEKDGRHIFTLAGILEECRPSAFIFENVMNLLDRDRGRTWNVIHSLLLDAGYSVFAKVLNSRHFGVPQSRERVMIVGFDRRRFGDDPGFRFPEPDRRIRSVLFCILEDQPDPKYTLSDKLWGFLQDHRAKHARNGNGFGFSLAQLDGITRTLSARYYKDGSEILVPQPCDNPRKLTPREAARLMGFPDELPIVVSDTQAYRQFGNAVVPEMVERVGGRVLEILERNTTAP